MSLWYMEVYSWDFLEVKNSSRFSISSSVSASFSTKEWVKTLI